MKNILLAVNMIIGILIIILILVQGRGAGLGSAWGGSGESFQTRRGVEKFSLQLTVFFIIVFFVISLINLFVM